MRQVVLLGLILSMIAAPAFVSAGTYEGDGIAFEYPDAYKLKSEDSDKGHRIKLKNGPSIIEIKILPNRFGEGVAESTAETILEKARKKFEVTDLNVEKEKKIPLKVKGKEEDVEVETLKYRYNMIVKKEKLDFTLKQTLYLFSFGKSGYIIQYVRTTEDFSDMIRVLSTFRFDEAEKQIVTETESVY